MSYTFGSLDRTAVILYQKYNLELSSHLDLSSTGRPPRFETMQCLHLDGRHTHYFGYVCRKNTLNSKKKTRWPNFSARRTAYLRCPIVSQSGFGISCTYSFPLSSTLYSLLASLPHSGLDFTVTPAEWPVRSSSGSSRPITTEMNGAVFKANYRAASWPTAGSPQDARSSQTPIWQGTNLQL